MKNTLKKRVTTAFGKTIYLLGQDSEGVNFWLESPKWDCNWYWGFGYVETYTNNNNPSIARDINSHQHINSSFVGSSEYYDREKGCSRKGEYIHNIYDSKELSKTTFTDKEGWKLSELFKQFYLLKEMASFTHKTPSAGLTTSPVDHGDLSAMHEEINKVMIPKITAEICRILSSNKHLATLNK